MHRILLIPVTFFLLCCSTKHSTATAEDVVDCNVKNDDTTGIAGKLKLDTELLNSRTAVYSLDDGVNSLVTRAWLCDQAQKTIDIQYYIFSKDNTGLIACDFLVRAADRGVKVRLIIDDITVKANSSEINNLDSHKNIEIRVYNPGVKLGKPGIRLKKILTEGNKLHRRMHVKTITVDDMASITGGRNIADEYYDYDTEYNFRDRDVMLMGRSVGDVKTIFEQYWNDELCVTMSELVNQNKKKMKESDRFEALHRYACDPENFSYQMREKIKSFPQTFAALVKKGEILWLSHAVFVADPPGKNSDRKNQRGGITTDSLVALIKNAKKSVDIQSPYLILTDEGKKLFTATVIRGVKVRVLTNSMSSTDNFEAFSGYQRDREGILATGIDVYEFKPDAKVRYKLMNKEVQSAMSYTPVYGLHSKTMIIDNVITVIGSFNLDPRSANFNTECIVIMRSKEFTKNVSRFVEEEFLPENAWHVTQSFNPDSEAKGRKRIKVASRKGVPKDIL